jgi:hypothetical protein
VMGDGVHGWTTKRPPINHRLDGEPSKASTNATTASC